MLCAERSLQTSLNLSTTTSMLKGNTQRQGCTEVYMSQAYDIIILYTNQSSRHDIPFLATCYEIQFDVDRVAVSSNKFRENRTNPACLITQIYSPTYLLKFVIIIIIIIIVIIIILGTDHFNNTIHMTCVNVYELSVYQISNTILTHSMEQSSS